MDARNGADARDANDFAESNACAVVITVIAITVVTIAITVTGARTGGAA